MDELNRAKELYNALHGICLFINSTLEIDVMMRTIVVESAKAMGCESSLIMVLENGSWNVKHVHNVPPEAVRTIFTETALATLAEEARKPVHAVDIRHDILIRISEVRRSLCFSRSADVERGDAGNSVFELPFKDRHVHGQ